MTPNQIQEENTWQSIQRAIQLSSAFSQTRIRAIDLQDQINQMNEIIIDNEYKQKKRSFQMNELSDGLERLLDLTQKQYMEHPLHYENKWNMNENESIAEWPLLYVDKNIVQLPPQNQPMEATGSLCITKYDGQLIQANETKYAFSKHDGHFFYATCQMDELFFQSHNAATMELTWTLDKMMYVNHFHMELMADFPCFIESISFENHKNKTSFLLIPDHNQFSHVFKGMDCTHVVIQLKQPHGMYAIRTSHEIKECIQCSFGVRHLSMANALYQKNGAIQCQTNIKKSYDTISIDVDEEKNDSLHAISYKLGFAFPNQMPTFFSIAPIHRNSQTFLIKYESHFINDFYYFELPMKAAHKNAIIYWNGKTIPETYASISNDLSFVCIHFKYYKKHANYYVVYDVKRESQQLIYPADTSWYRNKDGKYGEYFEHVNEQNEIQLQYAPYLFQEQQNEELQTINFKGLMVTVNDILYENITDYNKQTEKETILRTANKEHVYWHDENKISFPILPFAQALSNIYVHYQTQKTDLYIQTYVEHLYPTISTQTPYISTIRWVGNAESRSEKNAK